MSDIIAFIFARGGSKGLPRKNILDFCGKPLIAWSIEHAKSVAQIDRVIVSTDDKEIADTALQYGAEVPFMRPAELAQDSSAEWLSWQHALDYIHNEEGSLPKAMISVPATSPLRLPEDIQNCIDVFFNETPDAVISVTDAHRNPYFNMVKTNKEGNTVLVEEGRGHFANRQQAPLVFDMTTVAYVLCPKFVMSDQRLFNGKLRHVHVPLERSIDIDTKFDFELAEFIYKRSQQNIQS